MIEKNCTCFAGTAPAEEHGEQCLARRAHEQAAARREDLEANVVRVSLVGCRHVAIVRRTDEFGKPAAYAYCGTGRCRQYRRIAEEVEVDAV